MIDKSYLKKVQSKNILNNYKPKNLSSNYANNSTLDCIENMIVNSNLDENIHDNNKIGRAHV